MVAISGSVGGWCAAAQCNNGVQEMNDFGRGLCFNDLGGQDLCFDDLSGEDFCLESFNINGFIWYLDSNQEVEPLGSSKLEKRKFEAKENEDVCISVGNRSLSE